MALERVQMSQKDTATMMRAYMDKIAECVELKKEIKELKAIIQELNGGK